MKRRQFLYSGLSLAAAGLFSRPNAFAAVGQLKAGLNGFSLDSGSRLVIAYEPVWAIGTGRTATPDDADQAMGSLRRALAELYGERIANQIRILYGGSVKPDNIDSLMSRPNIDGALVGGASLKADSFARIVGFQAAQEVGS